MSNEEKEEIRIALEVLIFRDNAEKIYSENCTNIMVLEIAKRFNISISDQLSTSERDDIISKYRKLFKNNRPGPA